MDVPTLKLVLRPTLTVTSVCNTGETGNIEQNEALLRFYSSPTFGNINSSLVIESKKGVTRMKGFSGKTNLLGK